MSVTTSPAKKPSAKKRPVKHMAKKKALPLIGWREWVALPQLGIETIKAKIDTGARTSALHAWDIEPFERDGEAWVRFKLHPLQRNNRTIVACEARVVDRRQIRNSGGRAETRYVIKTVLSLGDTSRTIEVTLTNRDKMGFRLLLGRTAVKNRFLINAGRSYLGAKMLMT